MTNNAFHSSQNLRQQIARGLRISREKSDTLLLVFACLSVVLQHYGAIATWIILCSLALMAWRVYLTLSGRQLPPRWQLLPITMILMVAIFFNFHRYIGREAGVAMLLLLLSCKMLEMRVKNDLYVVSFLGFFLLQTSFFNSQTLSSALLVLLSSIALLLAQLSPQFAQTIPSLWVRLKVILKILALAVPITIIGFFLFPRITGPLWGLPSDANIARSGLSDSMSPGNISKLAMSEELVFRVKFYNGVPEKSAFYWRAMSLTNYDGRTWTKTPSARQSIEPNITVQEPALHQQIILEPSGTQNLFALESVVKAPSIKELGSQLNQDGEIIANGVINQRLRYEVDSYPHYILGANIATSELNASLQLPYNVNPLTRAYALSLASNYRTPLERVSAVLRYFRIEKFYYTLEPPPLGRDSVDEFLFTTRSGFCEHYSSAFVVIMRSMGIPARVVTGYQGGTLNTHDGYYEIRQSDAHAWAEVWLRDRGWVRVDPTAAVAPDRIIKNLSATQQATGLAGMVGDLIGQNSWFGTLRMQWSALNNSWNQWVLNYNEAKHSNLLGQLGLDNLDWRKTLFSIFIIGSLIIGSLALPLLRHRPQISPIDRLYLSLCAELQGQGWTRQVHEGPLAFLERLKSELPANKFTLVQAFMRIYIANKYQKNPPQFIATRRQLNLLLKQIRSSYF
ncbi:MAG: DUF3488 and transglutaminase-like domain-containing protein [Undibacterium sp.]|nr:DUF3488 and transglutaminase-like domain-containing protein [Undibacterium sp.]